MAVPKKKTSTSRKGLRRGGHTHKLSANCATMSCPICGSLTERNKVCPSCGHYKGRQVFTVAVDEDDTTLENE